MLARLRQLGLELLIGFGSLGRFSFLMNRDLRFMINLGCWQVDIRWADYLLLYLLLLRLTNLHNLNRFSRLKNIYLPINDLFSII